MYQILALAVFWAATTTLAYCPDYTTYAEEYHGPFSSGTYNLSYQRPSSECRNFSSQSVENTIIRLKSVISDPDLYRLFENSYPNTLDTAIKWHGYASNSTDEELTFIITGDINAMWLRDSANQLQSYLSLLNYSASNDSIASLYRGAINLQSRYINTSPHCNAFQPPTESGLSPDVNSYGLDDTVTPAFSNQTVYECKYELDSLAAFLEISSNYYNTTKDITFFKKYQWVSTVETILNVAESLIVGTYADNGSVNTSPYTFTRETTSGTETLDNSGIGNPVSANGLVRSAFRPSDDATIYQLFIPANMMFARYLESASLIMSSISNQTTLAQRMRTLATSIRSAIEEYGIINDAKYGKIYAYEIDGYSSHNVMDDANIPSLLAAPFFGYLDVNDSTYQSTRNVLLSKANPYFMRGPVINAIGGPHEGFGYAWPMASIVRILTSSNDTEIMSTLKEILGSTAGLGLIHESINTFNASDYTRQWYGAVSFFILIHNLSISSMREYANEAYVQVFMGERIVWADDT
ncbi:MAG: hypothetical protein M1834_006505 [Cirrosporium novae-zelandiae]|nr:MAG: hypothetical protein M1834_006505 [Cirrosporium novae-zelandiae]